MAADPFASIKLLLPGTTNARTLDQRFSSEEIDVTDFKNTTSGLPVVGDWNGTTGTDNTEGLQAAINAAWPGTFTSGGPIPGISRSIFIPRGNYMITKPLNLKGSRGTIMHGAGKGTTKITYNGSATEGNTQASGGFATYTPVFTIESVRDTLFSDFSIGGTAANQAASGSLTMGFFAMSQEQALVSTNGICTQLLFQNIGVDTLKYSGWHCGTQSNCENFQFWNCTVENCKYGGITAPNQNSLNHIVIGGLFKDCGGDGTFDPSTGSGSPAGALNGNGGGTFETIIGVQFENNHVDFYQPQSTGNMQGCTHRTGALSVCSVVVNNGNAQLFMSGDTYLGDSNKTFMFIGGECSIHNTCQAYYPNQNGAGNIARLGGNTASLALDNFVGGPSIRSSGTINCGIATTHASNVYYLRNCNFNGTPFPLITGGFPPVQLLNRPVDVSELPTPGSQWNGVQQIVKNFNGTPTFGGSIGSGGGSTVVRAFCNSSAWVTR